MSRSSRWLPAFNLTNDTTSGVSKRSALVQAIVQAITTGDLADGDRLPPIRDLAHHLSMSIQTVSASYKEVQRLGLIRSTVGSGSFVSSNVSDRSDRDGTFISAPISTPDGDLSVMLPVYTPAHDHAITAALAAMSHGDSRDWMYPSRPVVGQLRHREIASEWLKKLDVIVPPDRLFITNGATHGIFIALTAVARPGDVVLVEQLTENGIIGAANILGLNLKGIATDCEGVIPAALEAACQQDPVAALVWIPTFGNPTVHLASPTRREQIAQIARRHGIAVIEDEIHKPLLGEPYPSITSLLPEKGFFVTGLSKSIASGLRVGYLAAPNSFSLRIAGMIRATTWNAAPIMAELATRLINDGTADALIDVQRQELAKRQSLLQERLGNYVACAHPSSLSAWLKIPDGWNERDMVTALQEQGVLALSSMPFRVSTDLSETGIRICVSSLPDIQIFSAHLDTVRRTFDQLPRLV